MYACVSMCVCVYVPDKVDVCLILKSTPIFIACTINQLEFVIYRLYQKEVRNILISPGFTETNWFFYFKFFFTSKIVT